jgi:Glucose-6-phosphate dehydrogenase, NAD binding domain
MTTATRSHPASTAAGQPEAEPDVADVFVIFGITGDLAKVMTFNSLYRLEQRGLLSCPIVGVAVSDWSDDDLRAHAREAIVNCGTKIDEAVFDRLAARMSYVSGDFGEPETYQRVASAAGRSECPVFYRRDPAVPVRTGDQGADRRRPDQNRARRGREAVRPRPAIGP